MECRVMFTTGPGKWFISPDMINEMSYQSHRKVFAVCDNIGSDFIEKEWSC